MLEGFKARPQRPDRGTEPVQTDTPCPKCRKPTWAWPDAMVEEFDLPAEYVTVIGCGECLIAAAHVEGIQDRWRPWSRSEDTDAIIRDGHDGLRQWWFLNSDRNSPGFGPMRR